MIQQWGKTLVDSFVSIGDGVSLFIPNLIAAIIIFIVGWIIAGAVGRLISHFFKVLKVDHALNQAGVGELARRAEFTLNSGAFVGGLIQWFIVVVFLVASFDVLGLTQVNIFLRDVVLGYLPQVVVAVLILLVSAVISGTVAKIVTASAKAAHVQSASALGVLAKWSILVFAFLTALVQLGIAVTLIQTLFTGFVVALTLGFGLAFGLGGQAAASEFIAKVRRDFSNK